MSATAMLDYLTKNIGVMSPTTTQLDQYIRHCTMYEVRDDNAQTFNTAYLGVTKAYFFT